MKHMCRCMLLACTAEEVKGTSKTDTTISLPADGSQLRDEISRVSGRAMPLWKNTAAV